MVGYLSAALVCTTLGVNSVIYEDAGAKQAAAAGFILMSMVIVSTLRIRRVPGVGMLIASGRSCGYSISDQALKRLIVALSIHLRSIRKIPPRIVIADRCPTHLVVDPKHRRPLKCTRLPTSMALKHRHQFPDMPVVQLARKIASRSPSFASEPHKTAMWLSTPLGQKERCLNRRSIHTARRQSTHTTPTPRMPTRSVSASTRS